MIFNRELGGGGSYNNNICVLFSTFFRRTTTLRHIQWLKLSIAIAAMTNNKL